MTRNADFETSEYYRRECVVSMISLVTLAHRASNIHGRYASIHASVFSFSLAQLKVMFSKSGEPEYCKHEADLNQLSKELAEARAVIDGDEELEPSTTIGREFAFALDVYIIALSDTVERLSMICGRRCRDKKKLESYSDTQQWADRIEYDNAVQQYKRMGMQLGSLFKRF
ncbi:MAG: hypothetical protein GY703_15155 [Gammaproteobacteria bacterium]|nr:hypothetical protein [Gammaproteobacteria bacterium]